MIDAAGVDHRAEVFEAARQWLLRQPRPARPAPRSE